MRLPAKRGLLALIVAVACGLLLALLWPSMSDSRDASVGEKRTHASPAPPPDSALLRGARQHGSVPREEEGLHEQASRIEVMTVDQDPVPDTEIAIYSHGSRSHETLLTDALGRARIPDSMRDSYCTATVSPRDGYAAQDLRFWARGTTRVTLERGATVVLELPPEMEARLPLDVQFQIERRTASVVADALETRLGTFRGGRLTLLAVGDTRPLGGRSVYALPPEGEVRLVYEPDAGGRGLVRFDSGEHAASTVHVRCWPARDRLARFRDLSVRAQPTGPHTLAARIDERAEIQYVAVAPEAWCALGTLDPGAQDPLELDWRRGVQLLVEVDTYVEIDDCRAFFLDAVEAPGPGPGHPARGGPATPGGVLHLTPDPQFCRSRAWPTPASREDSVWRWSGLPPSARVGLQIETRVLGILHTELDLPTSPGATHVARVELPPHVHVRVRFPEGEIGTHALVVSAYEIRRRAPFRGQRRLIGSTISVDHGAWIVGPVPPDATLELEARSPGLRGSVKLASLRPGEEVEIVLNPQAGTSREVVLQDAAGRPVVGGWVAFTQRVDPTVVAHTNAEGVATIHLPESASCWALLVGTDYVAVGGSAGRPVPPGEPVLMVVQRTGAIEISNGATALDAEVTLRRGGTTVRKEPIRLLANASVCYRGLVRGAYEVIVTDNRIGHEAARAVVSLVGGDKERVHVK